MSPDNRRVGDGVRRAATDADMEAAGTLLDAFNREFDDVTPGPAALAARLRLLTDGGDTVVLLAGAGPIGVAVLRFRLAIWSEGEECYLAELYVQPAHRGRGVGRSVMEAAIATARQRGADWMEIGVDEPDHVARQLYESLGFTNRTDPSGAVMFVYEREL